jgi:hypothetical protein
MPVLGENGNASLTVTDIKNALEDLWEYVRNSGELQKHLLIF